jgi:hypothetical protein
MEEINRDRQDGQDEKANVLSCPSLLISSVA